MAEQIAASELGRYIFLTAVQQEEHPSKKVFDVFLNDMRMLYALRMKAEERYKKNRALANNDVGALPLDWSLADGILNPNRRTPRLGVVTKIANDTTMILLKLLGNIRKQLRRQREMTAIGRVQQVDAYCLRWISKRPGLTLLEKAGAKQEILSVVRKEMYDTLENRVLKSFLVNAEKLTLLWLKDHTRKHYENNEVWKQVQRFCNLSRGILSSEVLASVKLLTEIPIPNYTLQQDPLYSVIWKSYLIVTQYLQVASRLWQQREKLNKELKRIKTDSKKHLESVFTSELWIHPVDGKGDFFEGYFPVQTCPEFTAKESFIKNPLEGLEVLGLRVIDLLGEHQDDALLLPDIQRHPNAKARLICYSSPYIDTPLGLNANERYQKRIHYLNDILFELTENPRNSYARSLLNQYFEQLKAVVGGGNWLVLIPDSAEPEFQEVLRLSVSQVSGVNSVRLLWRTMAYALGYGNGRNTNVCCKRKDGAFDKANFNLVNNRLQRCSYRVQKAHFSSPSLKKCPRPKCWFSSPIRSAVDNDSIQCYERGSLRFWQATSTNPAFYDQLLGLYIVIQDEQNETAEFKQLIAPNEMHPGGFSAVSNRCSDLGISGGKVKFFFHEGLGEDENAHLRLFEDTLKIDEAVEMDMAISSSPGQGLTSLKVYYSDKAIQLTMHKVELGYINAGANKQKATLSTINRYMERSFPPDMPDVESDTTLFFDNTFVSGELTPENVFKSLRGDSFAQARYKYDAQNPPPADEPLGALIRCNVFGTHPQKRRPFDNKGWGNREYQQLFEMILTQLRRCVKSQAITQAGYSWLRLLAWTYQHDNPFFDDLRKFCVKLIVDKNTCRAEVITFCANFCRNSQEWKLLLNKICVEKSYEHCRLLYNLLMFCPTFPKESGLYQNTTYQKLLVDWLCKEFMYNNGTTSRNACLRSLLFLLRIRRFQTIKTFAKEKEEPDIYKKIKDVCNVRVYPVKTQGLQAVLLAYLDGNGKLEGLPQLLN